MSLLEIEKLSLDIAGVPILNGVDLAIGEGEVMGLVGESGSGKSMTALAVMRLLPNAARATGRVAFDGIDVLAAPEAAMNRLRGDDIGMVFQEPMTALNPVKTIGEQVAEGIRWHTGASRADAEARARAMLDRVGLPESKFPLSRYPHELSGGQRQRVVIAIACALNPKLLIADEPTTALDVVLQAQILDLLRDLVSERGMGLLLISHDLAVVTDMADRITIMRHGEVMEAGETAPTLSRQEHPYTRQLARASMHVPDRKKHGPAAGGSSLEDLPPLLSVENVTRDYPGRRVSLFSKPEPFRAVDGVSFTLQAGQSTALVGRSGCGKSTLARMILALDRPTAGAIRLNGQEVSAMDEAALRPARRDMQVVFQDPYGSFNPRHEVERLVAEPLHLLEEKPSPARRREMVATALHEVGLSASDMDKYPHEFSGGQRQRLSIARAIITRPRLVVADEPVSALDVSIRAQVLDLFADLNQRLGIAYLFITHDLTVARAITDEVMVMHEGRIVERGRTGEVLDNPQSDPARALVAAAPDLHRALKRRMGEQGVA
ncbi:dipeptide ABC transporter ATP-binding protein [Aquamicrobium sp. LC103]|uniref:ABC transporter ATP-binding protein n=1 Tax=Aquamicrobium sp. LC103 TaxID=1120658 RepID=UPI00063E9494|nr:dipeptide ABC transporter ATP-binding protein [Aquamicrobium sp. LC103]TKT79106.1 ABC transporter ATP-binding protein [Aquamicrobium sp. LC103]